MDLMILGFPASNGLGRCRPEISNRGFFVKSTCYIVSCLSFDADREYDADRGTEF